MVYKKNIKSLHLWSTFLVLTILMFNKYMYYWNKLHTKH